MVQYFSFQSTDGVYFQNCPVLTSTSGTFQCFPAGIFQSSSFPTFLSKILKFFALQDESFW